MRVCVLGATGFIGGQITRAAHAAGMQIHAVRRRAGAVGAIGDLPVTWHQGDLEDPASLVPAMWGCEVLFHAAGYAPFAERDALQATYQGVRQMRGVFWAAGEAGIARVVYTSSLTTIGAPPPGTDRLPDERDGYLPGSTRNPYYEAKWAMEHEALRANQAGLPVVTLCPTAAFGPGDVKPSTSRILLELAKGRLPFGIDVVTNIVDGRDVALAHVRAATQGAPGERYIVGGHNLNVAHALRRAAQILGVREPRWTLSVGTVRHLLRLLDLLRVPVPATVRGLPYWQPLNGEKGWQAFGLHPRPFEDTVRETAAWFCEHGYM